MGSSSGSPQREHHARALIRCPVEPPGTGTHQRTDLAGQARSTGCDRAHRTGDSRGVRYATGLRRYAALGRDWRDQADAGAARAPIGRRGRPAARPIRASGRRLPGARLARIGTAQGAHRALIFDRTGSERESPSLARRAAPQATQLRGLRRTVRGVCRRARSARWRTPKNHPAADDVRAPTVQHVRHGLSRPSPLSGHRCAGRRRARWSRPG
jgi:hypothetical protein